MREIRQSGSVRGVRSNPYPYRDFPGDWFRCVYLRLSHLWVERRFSLIHHSRFQASVEGEKLSRHS
jgi:hypothetical protein